MDDSAAKDVTESVPLVRRREPSSHRYPEVPFQGKSVVLYTWEAKFCGEIGRPLVARGASAVPQMESALLSAAYGRHDTKLLTPWLQIPPHSSTAKFVNNLSGRKRD